MHGGAKTRDGENIPAKTTHVRARPRALHAALLSCWLHSRASASLLCCLLLHFLSLLSHALPTHHLLAHTASYLPACSIYDIVACLRHALSHASARSAARAAPAFSSDASAPAATCSAYSFSYAARKTSLLSLLLPLVGRLDVAGKAPFTTYATFSCILVGTGGGRFGTRGRGADQRNPIRRFHFYRTG